QEDRYEASIVVVPITFEAGARSHPLTATESSDGLNTASAPSSAFNVTAGSATQLVFTQQPASSTGGVAFPTQPKVTVEDAGGNTVTGDSSTVTLAITSGTPTSGGPGTLSGCTQSETSGVCSPSPGARSTRPEPATNC